MKGWWPGSGGTLIMRASSPRGRGRLGLLLDYAPLRARSDDVPQTGAGPEELLAPTPQFFDTTVFRRHSFWMPQYKWHTGTASRVCNSTTVQQYY